MCFSTALGVTAFLVLFHCPITQPFDLLSLLSCKVMGGAFPLCFFHLRAVVWCHPLLYSTINEVVSVKTRFKFTKAEHSPCASNAFQLVFLLPRPFPDRHLVNDGTFPHCVVTAAFTRHSEIGLPWPFTDPALTVPSRPVTSCCKGLTVHIDNTDAEGRLVLADALVRELPAPPLSSSWLPAHALLFLLLLFLLLLLPPPPPASSTSCFLHLLLPPASCFRLLPPASSSSCFLHLLRLVVHDERADCAPARLVLVVAACVLLVSPYPIPPSFDLSHPPLYAAMVLRPRPPSPPRVRVQCSRRCGS